MRLRSQVIWTSISKSLKHVSVFILAIFLTRYFSKYEYGTYLQIMIIANTAIYLAVFGFPASIYYFLPRTQEKRRLIKNTVAILFFISVLVALCIYAASDVFGRQFNNLQLIDYGWLIAAFVLLQIPIKLYEPFMIASDNVARFVIVNATFNVGFLLSILIPVVLGYSLGEVLFSLFVFYIVQLLAIYAAVLFTYRQLVDDPDGEPYLPVSQLAYSAPIGLSGAISEIGVVVDKIVVSSYYDPEQLAVYARGAMEIPLFNVVANSLGNILMPRFVEEYQKGNINKVIELWHSSIRIMAMFVYPTLVFFILTADRLIPLLFTDAYLGSVIIFQIYTLGLIMRITSYDAIIRAIGKTKILFKMSFLSVSLNILLTIALIELIGIIGAPMATVLVGGVIRIFYLVVITRLLDMNMLNIFPWNSLLRLILISIIAGLVILPILTLSLPHFSMLVLSGSIYSVVYLIGLRFSGALSKSEKESVRGLLPRSLRWAV